MKLLTNDSAITTNDFYGHAETVSAIIDTLPIPDKDHNSKTISF